MTEPEQWAEDLRDAVEAALDGMDPTHAALTLQRAFEEQTRELREALTQIATVARSPVTMQQIARQALATRQPTPTEGSSHDYHTRSA